MLRSTKHASVCLAVCAALLLAGHGEARATGILLVPGVLTYGTASTLIVDPAGPVTTISTSYTSLSGLSKPGTGTGSCSGTLAVTCSTVSVGGFSSADISSAGKSIGLPAVNPSIEVFAGSTGGTLNDSAGRPIDYYSSNAEGALTYYFALVLKSNAVAGAPAIPVSVSGAISFSTPQPTVGTITEISILGPGGTSLLYQNTAGAFDENLILGPTTVYQVTLHASVTVSKGSAGKAIVDPYLTIDPAFADDYDIVYSADLMDSGTTVPSAVPEPSSWSLALTALAIAGCLGRSRLFRLS